MVQYLLSVAETQFQQLKNSAKLKISAVAGGPQIGGGAVLGGTEISKEVSILSRDIASSNGGWL